MAMNRVQFQKGLSLATFLKQYGTEDACEAVLVRQRWGAGFACAGCGGSAAQKFRRAGVLYHECRSCGRQTSVRAGTLFAHSRLPLTKWFLAIYLLVQTKTNLAALELMRHLNVCYRTAWRLKHKLLKGMENAETSRRLSGFVQIDDAYLGGELTGGTSGRGSENKVPFVIAVSTTEDDKPLLVVASRLSGFTNQAIRDWAANRLEPGCDVCSDGLKCFAVLSELGHAHTVHIAKRREAAKAPAMRWVNTVLSNIKRSIDGSYHSLRFRKYGQRYLSEAMWRFNRRLNLSTLTWQLIRDAVGCPPWTERSLRDKLTAY